jgi:hypothetical protein
MDKMLIAVFDNESAAFQGLSALKDLHKNGDVTLYASAVIAPLYRHFEFRRSRDALSICHG